MDRVLRAILRTELPFFIRKVFATISPGETYLHNWHVDAIAHQLMRVHSGEGRRLLINQPPHDDQVDSVSQFLRWLQNDAYQNPVLCAPILITRADMGLPPLHIDWSCRH